MKANTNKKNERRKGPKNPKLKRKLDTQLEGILRDMRRSVKILDGIKPTRSLLSATRESKRFWAVDGTEAIRVTGFGCPANPGMWWVPELGWSGDEGRHLFKTKQEAQDAAIRELKEEIAACQPSTPARASRQKTLAKLKQERAKIK